MTQTSMLINAPISEEALSVDTGTTLVPASPNGGAKGQLGFVFGNSFFPLYRSQDLIYFDAPLLQGLTLRDPYYQARTGWYKQSVAADATVAVTTANGLHLATDQPVASFNTLYVVDADPDDEDIPEGTDVGFNFHITEEGKSAFGTDIDIKLLYTLNSSSNSDYPHPEVYGGTGTPAASATFPIYYQGSTNDVNVTHAVNGDLWDGSAVTPDFTGISLYYLRTATYAEIEGSFISTPRFALSLRPVQAKVFASYNAATKRLSLYTDNGGVPKYKEGVWGESDALTAYTTPITITETSTYTIGAAHPQYTSLSGETSRHVLSFEIDPSTGESVTESFTNVCYVTNIAAKYQSGLYGTPVIFPGTNLTNTAVMPFPIPNRWVSPTGTGNGLSPSTPGDIETIFADHDGTYPYVVACAEGTYTTDEITIPFDCMLLGGYYNSFVERNTSSHKSILEYSSGLSGYLVSGDGTVDGFHIQMESGIGTVDYVYLFDVGVMVDVHIDNQPFDITEVIGFSPPTYANRYGIFINAAHMYDCSFNGNGINNAMIIQINAQTSENLEVKDNTCFNAGVTKYRDISGTNGSRVCGTTLDIDLGTSASCGTTITGNRIYGSNGETVGFSALMDLVCYGSDTTIANNVLEASNADQTPDPTGLSWGLHRGGDAELNIDVGQGSTILIQSNTVGSGGTGQAIGKSGDPSFFFNADVSGGNSIINIRADYSNGIEIYNNIAGNGGTGGSVITPITTVNTSGGNAYCDIRCNYSTQLQISGNYCGNGGNAGPGWYNASGPTTIFIATGDGGDGTSGGVQSTCADVNGTGGPIVNGFGGLAIGNDFDPLGSMNYVDLTTADVVIATNVADGPSPRESRKGTWMTPNAVLNSGTGANGSYGGNGAGTGSGGRGIPYWDVSKENSGLNGDGSPGPAKYGTYWERSL